MLALKHHVRLWLPRRLRGLVRACELSSWCLALTLTHCSFDAVPLPSTAAGIRGEPSPPASPPGQARGDDAGTEPAFPAPANSPPDAGGRMVPTRPDAGNTRPTGRDGGGAGAGGATAASAGSGGADVGTAGGTGTKPPVTPERDAGPIEPD